MGRTRMGWTAAAATTALLLAGCGGSDGADPPANDASVEAPANDDADADEGGTSTFTGDCDDALQAFRELQLNYLGSIRAFTPTEPIDYEAVIDEVEAAAADAPAEIRDDFRAYADAVTPFYEGLAEAGHDPSTPGDNDADAFVALTDALDTTTIDHAVLDIEAWFTGPCEGG